MRTKETSIGARESSSGPTVRTLDRGLAILEHLHTEEVHRLSDVARAVGLSASTTYRLLETLVTRGFAQRDTSSGRYSLGVRAFEVGASYVRTNVPEVALSGMRKLAEQLNESVNLAVRDGQSAVYIQQIEGRQSVRMFTKVGARVPLYCTGVGKALLAWEERGQVATLSEEQWVQFTPHTHTTIKSLGNDLDQIVKVGIAIDDEEFEMGVRCAAAPLRSRTGRVVAALSVSAPIARFGHDRIPVIREELLQCAGEISSRLGWANS